MLTVVLGGLVASGTTLSTYAGWSAGFVCSSTSIAWVVAGNSSLVGSAGSFSCSFLTCQKCQISVFVPCDFDCSTSGVTSWLFDTGLGGPAVGESNESLYSW